MVADRPQESSTPSLSTPEQALDPDSPEFIDACLALIKNSAARGMRAAAELRDDARGDITSQATASAAEDVRRSPTRSLPGEAAGPQLIVRRLETQIADLREALAEARAQIEESSETLREHEVLRQTLAGAREHRSSDVNTLEDLTQAESDAPGEAMTLDELVHAVMSDRDADISALREGRRREAKVRTELETLRAELTDVEIERNNTITAFEAASQRAGQAHAELATAMRVISDRDSAIEQLRQTLTERDREIDELQRHLLLAEAERVSDAAAFLDSLNKYRT